jgi:hypothetical protein
MQQKAVNCNGSSTLSSANWLHEMTEPHQQLPLQVQIILRPDITVSVGDEPNMMWVKIVMVFLKLSLEHYQQSLLKKRNK